MTLSSRFSVRVRMLTDWQVGTGSGRVGTADSTCRRDPDGLPFVPAKTLIGVWRDACEHVAGWLDVAGGLNGDSSWSAWVAALFGTQPAAPGDAAAQAGLAPRPAAVQASPARIDSALASAVRGRPMLAQGAFAMRPGVALDANGVARADFLRMTEVARPVDLVSELSVGLGPEPEVPQEAELLLRAGAAALESLGADRNRGLGRCAVLLPGVLAGQPDAALAALLGDATLLAAPGSAPHAAGERWVPLDAPVAGPVDERTEHHVVVEARTPVVVRPQVLGNVITSADVIPGTVLLPLVLRALSEPVAWGQLVVSDARPAVVVGAATCVGVPAPLTWQASKDDVTGAVVNLARRPGLDRSKPVRGHVVALEHGFARAEPARTVTTHAVVDDAARRPTTATGGVYSTLGLAPGTRLAFTVTVPAGVELRWSTGDVLRVGRSRKDDYGQLTVVEVGSSPVVTGERAGLKAGAEVAVWCRSDVLLRDAWGAWAPDAEGLAAELQRRWSVPVTAVRHLGDARVPTATAVSRVDSFQVRWGRSRPSLVGLAAGSVVTVQVGGEVGGTAVADVERDGLGERVMEGFGRVEFDPAVLRRDEIDLREAPDGVSLHGQTGPASLPDDPHPWEVAAWRAEIVRACHVLVLDDDSDAQARAALDTLLPSLREPRSRSQWASLRDLLPLVGEPEGRSRIEAWAASTCSIPARHSAWGGARGLDPLERLLLAPADVWPALLAAGLDPSALVLDPARVPLLQRTTAAFAVRCLLEEFARHRTRLAQAGDDREVAR